MKSPQIYTRTLLTKASYATTALAILGRINLTLGINIRARSGSPNSCSVFLNCDAGGTANLDVNIEISPDESSSVWYLADNFDTVSVLASAQVKTPGAMAKLLRVAPVLTGTHNFGCQVAYPINGWITQS